MRKKIAILAGGDVAEREISLLSAQTIYDHLDRERYEPYLVVLTEGAFHEKSTGRQLDLNDFTFLHPDTNERVAFDTVIPYIHGHPVEDGELQGYFKLLGIPYTGCDTFVSALTFRKQACKDFLATLGIPLAPSVLIRRGRTDQVAEAEQLALPLFVKPNKNGSSYGITKVNDYLDLPTALEHAFAFDDEVIVEGYLPGREFSNGVVRRDGEMVVLPITEIIPEGEYFDYDAKYQGKSREVTPAELSPEQTAACQERSRQLYDFLGCRGVVRFDYILSDGEFHLLEPNTTPGFSPASLIPQQTVEHGWTLTELWNAILDDLA